MTTALTLERHNASLAIVQLEPDGPVPAWVHAGDGEFISITRTPKELSIVCAAERVPENAKAERNWTALKIVGPLSFDQVGIIASLAAPLKQAGIPIFVISTYDTDYILVKETDIDVTITVLNRAGHVIRIA